MPETGVSTNLVVRDLGLVDYDAAYDIQKECVKDVIAGRPPVLLLCEHPAVLTMGRMTKEENLLVPREALKNKGVLLRPVDRGGDITLHSPGQLVAYPILNLNEHGRDLHFYLRKLEEVIIDLLGRFGILAGRFPGQTGVWAQDRKIASIGIGVRKWVSFHGLAVNVNTDLDLFLLIRPCGLNVTMTSMNRLKGSQVDMNSVKEEIMNLFCRHFNLSIAL